MVNTDFLISPAYQVPPIATTRSVKFTRMAQSDAVPSSSGSAWKPGRFRMVKSGLKPSSSSRPGPQEHVAGEQVVPGGLGDDAHADAVRRIGAGPAVAHEQVAALGVAQHAVVEGAVALGRDRLVGLAPVDAALGARSPRRRTCRWASGRYARRCAPRTRRRRRAGPRRAGSPPRRAREPRGSNGRCRGSSTRAIRVRIWGRRSPPVSRRFSCLACLRSRETYRPARSFQPYALLGRL